MNLYSPAEKIGELLAGELKKDPHFYFFSPDETTSNKLDQIFTVEKRAWGLPQETWDLPESANGRIVEMLSENVLFSVMTGHLMNGEKAMMGSYEAFLMVCASQILQQIKFIKQMREVAWRAPLPAVNLLSTSTCWRQDHNGFTHQSPALISLLLDLPSNLVNCFFPIDDSSAAMAFQYMINSHDVVNLTTFNKIEEPRFLGPEQAKQEFREGAMVYDFVPGVAAGEEPDVVFAACGDVVAREVVEAIKIIHQDLPEIRLRMVYIDTLSYGAIGRVDQKLSRERFDQMFTAEKPIVANFHGYPATLKGILANYASVDRLHVHGFLEEGSTTTPFEMLRRNQASRFDLAIEVAKLWGREDLIVRYQEEIKKRHAYAVERDEDMIN